MRVRRKGETYRVWERKSMIFGCEPVFRATTQSKSRLCSSTPPTEMGRWRGQDLNDLSIWIAPSWPLHRDSQVAQWLGSHLPMQETWVQSLGRENPLAEGMATHSSILAGKIPWTEESDRLQSVTVCHRESDTTERTYTNFIQVTSPVYWEPRQRKRVINNLIPCQFVYDKGSYLLWRDNQFSSVTQSCPAFCNPMDWAHQASLSITNSRSSSKLMSI